MARSLRSKSRRKLMAIKRKRYGKKELIRLKKMLGLPTGEEVVAAVVEVKTETDTDAPEDVTVVTNEEVQQIEEPNRDQDQDWEELEEDIAEVIKMKRTHKMRKSHRPNARDGKPRSLRHKVKEGVPAEGEELMEHDQRRFYSKLTQRDQYGNYPIWMNQKTVKQLAKKSKKIKRLEKKKQYKQRCKTGTHKRKYSKQTMSTETAGLNEAIIGFKKIGV